jgi:lipopolysaccharide transport protein LptA
MKSGILFVISAALIIAIASAAPARAAEAPEIGLTPQVGNIEEFRLIHADSMTLTRQKDKPQVFEGAVDIVLVDEADQETSIKAEKITVFYEQDLKKVRRIEAEGSVKVSRLGTVATTDLAVYRGDDNVIELLIDPHVKDARGELSANKITVYLDTDDVVAEGNVRGIVYPKAFE